MESGEGEEVNIEELAANLSTYREQLEQVIFMIALFFYCSFGVRIWFLCELFDEKFGASSCIDNWGLTSPNCKVEVQSSYEKLLISWKRHLRCLNFSYLSG